MTHEGVIESELTGGYIAGCGCGWAGTEQPTMDAASDELIQHYAEHPEERSHV